MKRISIFLSSLSAPARRQAGIGREERSERRMPASLPDGRQVCGFSFKVITDFGRYWTKS